jgi:hypothetical protein
VLLSNGVNASEAMNTHTTIEELLEVLSAMQAMVELHIEDHQTVLDCHNQ